MNLKYVLLHFLLLVFVSGIDTSVAQGAYETASSETSQQDDDPFRVNVTYTGDIWSNLSGGLGRGIRYLDNIDVNLEIDIDKLPLGLKETTVYIYGLGNQGGSISDLSGDLQGISNIESFNSWRFFEAWIQKKFLLAKSSILIGLYDINSEFNVINSSLLFLNSSHGLDPSLALSGVLGPSTFPYTSFGGRIKVNPAGGWVVQVAVLDGIPSNPANPIGTKVFFREEDGLLFLSEVGLYSVTDKELQLRNRTARLQHLLGRRTDIRRYQFALGGWAYSKKRAGWISVAEPEREFGIYGLGEYQIFNESMTSGEGLTVFGRFSLANEQTNRLAGYLGGGLVYKGFLKSRDKDELGIAVAHAINSDKYRNQNTLPVPISTKNSETNFELTYLSVLTSSVSLQADLQYIINPNMRVDITHAFSVGFRMQVSF